MTSKPDSDVPDERLLAAHDLALSALHEITPAETVGDAAGYSLEDDGVVSLRFANRLAGYPGWFWTVSLARIEDDEPTVLEVELLPGEDALLAPDWVPWAERLADYQAQQAILEAERAAAGVDEESDDDADVDDLDDDEDDLDADDADDAGMHVHGGDIDGVDIDLVADDDESDEDDDGSDEDESDDDDDGSDEDEDDGSEEDGSEEDDDDVDAMSAPEEA
ncbi:DUF3027 domain-containing protein [Microbacterium rhizosphaerae]|uniref:DUF3027 domain-containing protein n=1 Tax=Microbacterium rhizosphaerae TaxID=1678237 RepID=A0ABZ0SHR2_9MICO|nr:DUF3027 domain-containing protein [Microbacterium rhizosphaerae]WPR88812.1 DUF3027 domain-containing protein [Microbacterium rhizosphaerae]